MNSFIKIYAILIISYSHLLSENSNNQVFFYFSATDAKLSSINQASYKSLLFVQDPNRYPSPYFDLFGGYSCTTGLVSDGAGAAQCLQTSANTLTFTSDSIYIPATASDSSKVADVFNNLPYSSNNMISNQSAFTMKESDNDGDCVPKSVKNHQPNEMSFYVALDLVFEVNGEKTTCESVLLGMQHVSANIFNGIEQIALTSYNTSDDSEVQFGTNCANNDPANCTKKSGSTGKTIKKAAKEADKTIKAIECSGDIWWMSQIASPANSGFDTAFTFYPYEAPSWLGLDNENFINAMQCSNNYTMFFTHRLIPNSTDLDSNQGCTSDKNKFNISFRKTVQGGYN
jgi:hypothetical protein